MAFVVVLSMVIPQMPQLVSQTYADALYGTGFYNGSCYYQDDDFGLQSLSSSNWLGIGNEINIIPIFAENKDGANVCEYIQLSDVKIGYSEEILDMYDISDYDLDVLDDYDGYLEEYIPTQEEIDYGWRQATVDASKFFGDGQTVPYRYFRFLRTGSYKFTYTKNGVDYYFSVFVEQEPWGFYYDNEVDSTSIPADDIYYQDVEDAAEVYLVNNSSENIHPGYLKYKDGNVEISASGEPAIDEMKFDNFGDCYYLAAGVFEWNEDIGRNELTGDCSEAVDFDMETGRISLNEKADEYDDIRVIMYYYEETNYSEWDSDLGDYRPVKGYRQRETSVSFIKGVAYDESVGIDYQDWNGSVSYKNVDEDEYSLIDAYERFTGDAGEKFDFLLCEKPNVPENFNWGTATEQEIDSYGNRGGSVPIVRVRSSQGNYEYHFGAKTYGIDDFDDDDENTWHFTYEFNPGDELKIFWSEYDSFDYDNNEEFQIEVDSPSRVFGGKIEIAPLPSADKMMSNEKYGIKYNYSGEFADKITVKFIPEEGAEINEIWIGNKSLRNRNLVENDSGIFEEDELFTPAEDGSYTYCFKADDVLDKWYDGENWEYATNPDGSYRFSRVQVSANFDFGSEPEYMVPGFVFSCYPESENAFVESINSVTYKINDDDWITMDNVDEMLFDNFKSLEKGDTISLRFDFREGYTISETDFKISLDNSGGRWDIPFKDKAAVIAALTGNNGYTFTYDPEKDSAENGADVVFEPTDTVMTLQFHVQKEYANKKMLNIFIQSKVDEVNGKPVYGDVEVTPDDGEVIVDGIFFAGRILAMFNGNAYGGWDEGAVGTVNNNASANPVSITYNSTLPNKNGQQVTITPAQYLQFEVGVNVDGENADNILNINDGDIDELYYDANNDGIFEPSELVQPSVGGGEPLKGFYVIYVGNAVEAYNIYIRRSDSEDDEPETPPVENPTKEPQTEAPTMENPTKEQPTTGKSGGSDNGNNAGSNNSGNNDTGNKTGSNNSGNNDTAIKAAETTAVPAKTATSKTATSKTSQSVKLAKAKIAKASRVSKGKKVRITIKRVNGAKSYEIQYSTSKKFDKKTTKKAKSTKLTKTISKLKTNKTYYIRVRAVAGKAAGPWSKVKVVKR